LGDREGGGFRVDVVNVAHVNSLQGIAITNGNSGESEGDLSIGREDVVGNGERVVESRVNQVEREDGVGGLEVPGNGGRASVFEVLGIIKGEASDQGEDGRKEGSLVEHLN